MLTGQIHLISSCCSASDSRTKIEISPCIQIFPSSTLKKKSRSGMKSANTAPTGRAQASNVFSPWHNQAESMAKPRLDDLSPRRRRYAVTVDFPTKTLFSRFPEPPAALWQGARRRGFSVTVGISGVRAALRLHWHRQVPSQSIRTSRRTVTLQRSGASS